MLTVLALACSSDPPQDTGPVYAPLTWEADEIGPFNPGFRSVVLDYESPLGGTRAISLNIWYPTTDSEGETVRYMDAFEDPLALGGAELADPVYSQGYPVHVYSHGYQGWGGNSPALMRHLASHGWVAIAPDHLGNTLQDHQDPMPTAQYIHRPADVRAALDHLEGLDLVDPLSRADTTQVALSGHGFGAYTAWASAGATFDGGALDAACPGFEEGGCTSQELAIFVSGDLEEPRVKAVIPMAEGIRRELFGAQGHASVQAPFLLLTGSEDGEIWQGEDWESLSGVERTWVELQGGCHQSFTDGSTCATLAAEEGARLIKGYVTAFSRVHLRGDSRYEAHLAGEVSFGEAAVVKSGD